MLPSSTHHLNVPDAATSVATCVFDRRKCQSIFYSILYSLTWFRFKKTKREETFDPQLVAAVEAKLRALDVDSDIPTSGLEAA
jgi:meiotically up-regulated gene 157 (Mug157) protein